jgi:hypothetical protein
MFGGASISCSRAVTSTDGTGYVVSLPGGVNGVRRSQPAHIAWTVVAALPANEPARGP